jgi:hypothetical protein
MHAKYMHALCSLLVHFLHVIILLVVIIIFYNVLRRFSIDPPYFSYNSLCQKGLVVAGMFSRILTIEASVADLQPLVMCTADSQVTRPY